MGSRVQIPSAEPDTARAPEHAQPKRLVPGPWPLAPGPPTAKGVRSAWLWVGPEASSRKLLDPGPVKLPGRPELLRQAAKGREEHEKKVHRRRRP